MSVFACVPDAGSTGADTVAKDEVVNCEAPVGATDAVGVNVDDMVAGFFFSLWWSGRDGGVGGADCKPEFDWLEIDSGFLDGGEDCDGGR